MMLRAFLCGIGDGGRFALCQGTGYSTGERRKKIANAVDDRNTTTGKRFTV
ncbi:hypothetical protein [[Phormidium] sp. ETS-05]|uniref:hypothetical protein n=1 Tax=[Phormidium] sp. ETS-05 TaxID=222819 RepID=UPI0018EF298F|nr:hypothetical protein [[Phormidium] sp. ETS-05]